MFFLSFQIFIYVGLSYGMSDFCCGAQALQCGVWASKALGSAVEAYGIFVPRRGIEPISPALEVGFLTTGPPGKSLPQCSSLKKIFLIY